MTEIFGWQGVGRKEKKKVSVSHAKEVTFSDGRHGKSIRRAVLPFSRGTIFFSCPLIPSFRAFVLSFSFSHFLSISLPNSKRRILLSLLIRWAPSVVICYSSHQVPSLGVLVLAGSCAAVSASSRPFPLPATDLASTGCSFQLAPPPFAPRL